MATSSDGPWEYDTTKSLDSLGWQDLRHLHVKKVVGEQAWEIVLGGMHWYDEPSGAWAQVPNVRPPAKTSHRSNIALRQAEGKFQCDAESSLRISREDCQTVASAGGASPTRPPPICLLAQKRIHLTNVAASLTDPEKNAYGYGNGMLN